MKHKIGKVLFTTLCAVMLTGCGWFGEDSSSFQKKDSNVSGEATEMATVVKTEENLVVIKVLDLERGVDMLDATLLDVMYYLQTETQQMSYTLSGTMISSINGKSNPSDFSSCWMLYTSDSEMSNREWGTVTVDGQTLGSAVLGADALPVAEGELYVWSYQSF